MLPARAPMMCSVECWRWPEGRARPVPRLCAMLHRGAYGYMLPARAPMMCNMECWR